jgi:hypothetical protein
MQTARSIVEKLVATMRDETADDEARVNAALEIIERGWGLPQQTKRAGKRKHAASGYSTSPSADLLICTEI